MERIAWVAGEASEDDAGAIARIHRASWEAAYRGLIDGAVLDGMRQEVLAAEWRDEIRAPSDPGARVLVVRSADRDSRVFGYCRYGPGLDPDVDPARSGEIHGLYVHPDRWGHGFGRVLLTLAMDELRVARKREIRLWVAERNERARRFYERQGFVLEGGANDFHGAKEVRYMRALVPLPGSEEQADVLADECRGITGAIRDLDEDAFSRPTRCTGWNVAQLLAHIWRDIDWIRQARSTPSDDAPQADAVSYWRFHAENDAGAVLAEEAVRIAAEHRSGRVMRLVWDRTWLGTVRSVLETEPDHVVRTWGPVMTFGDFVETRILELAVHGLDLAEALGLPPWLTDGAVASATRVLTALLGAKPPGSLGWDAPTFLDAATGRRPLAAEERRELGELAERLPLLT